MIDLNDLKRIALENAEKRQKNGANITTDTRKMLKHCATEVIESAEAYTEYSGIKNLADDINATDIDIERAIYDCIEKNERRANGIGDKL